MTILLARPAFADYWYEHYDKAAEAINAQRWEEAIQELTQAIQKRAEPGTAVRTYGMNFVDYHPYLKLGITYFNMGKIEEALEAFDSEEKFGAIRSSTREMKNLQTFRKLAEESRRLRALTEQERLAAIVARSIEDSNTLEQGGRFEEAMAALGKALAVDPTNTAVQASLQRLRGRVAEQGEARDRDERALGAATEARGLLAAGKFEEASSLLNQALLLKPVDDDIKRLLAESQEKLRVELEATRTAEQQRTFVQDNLSAAVRFEGIGKIAMALERLQSVLALEPGNRQAVEMQTRLSTLQSEAELSKTRDSRISNLLDDAVQLLKQGQYARSVTGFNTVVALDPNNAVAWGYLGQAFVALNQSILAGGAVQEVPKLPPIIVLANSPNAVDDTQRPEERISSSRYELQGVIISDQPQVVASFLRVTDQSAGREESSPELVARNTDLVAEPSGSLYQFRFHQSVTLTPGVAILRLTVEDPRGISSQHDHLVRYVRPITQSPWFYSSLALLGIAGVGSVQGYRLYRRNQLFKRRFNPYIAGAPVLDNDLFLGREGLLSRILQTIHNNSILLYGERRIGKTSLQHHLRIRLQQIQDPVYEFHAVYVDLQGTPQERFFRTLADDIFEELSPILEGARPGSSLPAGHEYTYETFVRDVHGVMKALKKQSLKRVKLVLLIDEVDELNSYDPRINQKLRSLFMKSFAEDLVAVVSGVGIKKHWASEGSPWYNFFEEIEVKPFTRDDARDLVERPIRGVFKLEKNALDRILDVTNCRPYLIQKMCVALVNRMHDEKRRRITVSDVEAVGRPVES